MTLSAISRRLAASSFLRLPPAPPSARATARPAEVRLRITARSNSANEPTICIIMRPAGVVVSMLSVIDRKPGAGLGDPLHDVQHVLEAAAQAIELPDDDGVAVAELVEHAVQLRSVPAPAGRGFLEQLAASRRLQRLGLQRVVLLVRLSTRARSRAAFRLQRCCC
jgi:hypothetical protein